MLDWNLVVTTHAHRYGDARAILAPMGELCDTDYYNVLVMRVAEPQVFLAALDRRLERMQAEASSLARVLPVTAIFSYQSPEEFELKAATAARAWLAQLAGTSVHVRMHRRGFKGRISSQEEAHRLADSLIAELTRRGETARVDFDEPDWILAVETVGQRAGLSLWSRDALRRYPLLKLD